MNPGPRIWLFSIILCGLISLIIGPFGIIIMAFLIPSSLFSLTAFSTLFILLRKASVSPTAFWCISSLGVALITSINGFALIYALANELDFIEVRNESFLQSIISTLTNNWPLIAVPTGIAIISLFLNYRSISQSYFPKPLIADIKEISPSIVPTNEHEKTATSST